MATLLGIDFSDDDHPLTLGTMLNGNSIVGDTLVLTESAARSYLSLLNPEDTRPWERYWVERFFDRYAHTVTILLHGPARDRREEVAALLPRLLPATVAWNLVDGGERFVVGLSPLLSADTYLESEPQSRPVIANDTWLGREGLLRNAAAFVPAAVPDSLEPT